MSDSILFYRTPASQWEEALPIGNGALGAMVFGGAEEERLQLNEETMWTGWPYDNDSPETLGHLGEMRELIFGGRYEEAQKLCEKYLRCRGGGSHGSDAAYGSYTTAGDLYISHPSVSAGASYRRYLDMRNGEAVTEYENGRSVAIASYRYGVIAVRLEGAAADASLRYERSGTDIAIDGNDIVFGGYLPTKYSGLIRVTGEGSARIVYIAVRTAYKRGGADTSGECLKLVEAAEKDGWDKIYGAHKAYMNGMIDRVRLDLGGEDRDNVPTEERIKSPEGDNGLIEKYFMFGRYLLVSSSRGMLPANLQGIWSKDYKGPWSCDYHININIQMNYWPAEICGLSELEEPFFRYVEGLTVPGAVTAKTAYGCGGWVAHTVTNPWGFTALGDHPSWGSFMCAGAWCCRHYYDHYLFTRDVGFLRRYYAVMRGAAEFFTDFLVEDPTTGYLVTCPSNSPENSYIDPSTGARVGVTSGPTMDNAIIRELFTNTASAASVLGVDEDFAEKLTALAKRLPPYKIGKYGQIMEWQSDFDEVEPGHRHMSHMYGLHPSDQITKNTPELFEGAKKAIERRLANGGGHTGWSRAWIINFYARLGMGDKAAENVTALLKNSTLPDMFDNHPPFQIDGNFGGCAGIAEALLQSHEGYINILPALPKQWKDGSFKGLRARGGYEVSAEWRGGRVTSYEVKPCVGDPVPMEIRIMGEKV